jgi:CBS domain-containing protein
MGRILAAAGCCGKAWSGLEEGPGLNCARFTPAGEVAQARLRIVVLQSRIACQCPTSVNAADTEQREERMRAADVMTPNVITVDPDTSVQQLAALLSERGISGAPVVDSSGTMIGIVSEGDLLHRTELGTEKPDERRTSWWLDHYASGLAQDYVKSHGRTVRDIMSRDVIAVTEETSLAEVATLLETRRIKRVPVLRDGKIVGILSRSNLVRALGATLAVPAAGVGVSDDDRSIRSRLLAELSRQQWTGRLWPQDILVSGGVVQFWFGSDEPEEKRQAMRVAAENIQGVRSVEEHLVPIPFMPVL